MAGLVEKLTLAEKAALCVGDSFWAMRGVERTGDLDGRVDQRIPGQRPAGDPALERLSLEQLHRDEARAVGFLDRVDRADVRMVQGTGGPGLAREAFACRGIVKPLFQELDDDRAIDGRIAGEVERAHAAVSKEPLNAVPPDRRRRLCHFSVEPLWSTATVPPSRCPVRRQGIR